MIPVLLLAIDTSTSAVTVALHDGEAVLAESTTIDARRHTELVAAGMVQVLAESGRRADEVTQVAVGVGPGPFTGLRVGLVSARTFGYARGIPVGGVCSLDVLAHQSWQEGNRAGTLLVATDARRAEVYSARYAVSADGVDRLTDPSVEKPEAVAARLGGARVVGRGALLYPRLLDPAGAGGAPLDASAGSLASLAVSTLGRGGTLLAADPMYLRRPDVSPASARKPVGS